MGLRTYVGMSLIKLSKWLGYLIIALLPPDDIVNLAKIHYIRNADRFWNKDADLNEFEEEIFRKHLKNNNARILILGCGGGRESIALAKLGFNVVGIDMIEKLIRAAKENAAKEAVMIDFICDEFSRLSLPNNSFDYVFFSLGIYQEIPTIKRRVKILRHLRGILKIEGKLILNFHLPGISSVEKKLYPFHKVIAWLTLGNMGYQLGDRPTPSVPFFHVFTTKEEVHNELVKAGFNSIEFSMFSNGRTGYAVAAS